MVTGLFRSLFELSTIAASGASRLQPELSIIVPILNEARVLPALLSDIAACRQQVAFPLECIVVDGGSTDESLTICRDFDLELVGGPRGRGQQLVAGVEKARGRVLMFLHADCHLTAEHCAAAVAAVQQNGLLAGAFHLRFDDDHPILKFAEVVNKVRFKMTRVFYGDHAIFISRENYDAVGGFSAQALFEDIEFSRRLKRLGKVVLISPAIETSARRFRSGGVVRTYLKMASLHILHWLHVSPELLAKWYQSNSNSEDTKIEKG